jgi:hypothetical protein
MQAFNQEENSANWMEWMIYLPSACCLIPMGILAALRLGEVFFFLTQVTDGSCV